MPYCKPEPPPPRDNYRAARVGDIACPSFLDFLAEATRETVRPPVLSYLPAQMHDFDCILLVKPRCRDPEGVAAALLLCL